MVDNSNDIPKDSNIFQFTPIQIDKGSGGYWWYGKDTRYYYYFSETNNDIYYKILIKNNCLNFEPTNFQTWCESVKLKNLQ